MIPVTRPAQPPLSDYLRLLENIWSTGCFTNNGPLLQQLERDLAEFLDVPHVLVVANGTLALQIAIKALELDGDVITTPFSYVATTSAIAWEGCKPVFADIDQDTLNLDPRALEAAMTPRTGAILATHVYGNACDVDAIGAIARRRGLRVVYDAAHAFAVRYAGRSILRYGDISTLSFHATKLFHTVEGGAVVTGDPVLAERMAWLRNFGHATAESFVGVGINAKLSELHAAMGLCLLPRVPGMIDQRRVLCERYDAALKPIGSRITRPRIREGSEYNYAYYPVIFESEAMLMQVRDALVAQDIHPRRYFYPSLSKLPYVEPSRTPVSDDVATRVLCLPLWAELAVADVDRIARVVGTALAAT